jgi:chromosome segregation ATPase
MNLDQASQLITWLDEEHRKDKAQLGELANQLSQQYTQVAGLGKNLMDLEERLARVQSQGLRYSQLEQAAGQTKAEVQLMLEQDQKRRQKEDEESFKIRQLERERQDQVLVALQMQLEALQQWQRSTIGDHDLIQRVGLTTGTYQRELEEGIQRDEDHNRRLLVIEEWVSRVGQLTSEMHTLSERLRQERADAAEAGRRAEQQRARHMAEWSEQMKSSRREIDEWLAQIRGVQEKYKEDRKIFPGLQELEERLKQTESRLLQWQRLVEETRRKEREQVVADVDKRWQQQLGEWQFLRDEWTKRLAAATDRVTKLEDWRPEVAPQLHDLAEKIDKEHRDRVAMVAEVVKVEAEIERARMANVDKVLNDLVARIEGEKGAVAKPKHQKAAAGSASSNGG